MSTERKVGSVTYRDVDKGYFGSGASSGTVYGAAIWFVLGILYFALSGRKKLVLSPEEEFAMTAGQHGDPEEEGYGTTAVADTTT